MKFFTLYIFVVILGILSHGSTLPISIDNTTKFETNSKSIEFNFTFPNSEILKINISFVMLKESPPFETRDNEFQLDAKLTTKINETGANKKKIRNPVYSLFKHDLIKSDTSKSSIITTITTTSSPPITDESSLSNSANKLFTVDDAIEVFRKELFKKEWNMGGIIESKDAF